MRRIAINGVTEAASITMRGANSATISALLPQLPKLMDLAHEVFRLLGGGQRVVAKEARPPALDL